MAEVKRRGYGEDGIYFDHRADCRDSTHHEPCSGRWRGWSRSALTRTGTGSARRSTARTRTDVKDKLKGAAFGLDGGRPEPSKATRSKPGYRLARPRVCRAGLPRRWKSTGMRSGLLITVIGRLRLRDLTALQDVLRTALGEDGSHPSHADPSKAHELPEPGAAARRGGRSVPPESLGAGRRSHGREGAALAASDRKEQAAALLEAAEDSTAARVHRAVPADQHSVAEGLRH